MSDTLVAEPEKPASPLLGRFPRRAVGWPRILGWAVLLLVLLALPLYLPPGLLSAGEYVMVGAVGAIGLTLALGQTGLLTLAHGFFLLLGGTSYVVLSGESGQAGAEFVFGLGWPPPLALIGAVVVSALAGLAFAPVSGRLSGIYLGLASLSLVFVGFYLGQAVPVLTGGSSSGRDPEPFSLFGFPFTNEGDVVLFGVPLRRQERLWYLFLVLLVIGYLLARGAVNSRIGRAWRGVRDNESAAAVMGVNVLRAKAGAFAVSSAYAGLAGVMLILWLDILKPDESEFGTFGLDASIAFLAMAIIGGLGSIPGAVVGALIVFGLPQILTLVFSDLGVSTLGGFTPIVISLFVYGLAVIAVVLFEPGGLAAIGRRLAAPVLARVRRTERPQTGTTRR